MTAANILERIANVSVLVIGDICLDRWCHYDPAFSEPSRETGIPRIAVTRTTVTAGAAGTVASNLTALLARHVAVLGVVGEDGFGYELERALMAREISPELVVRSSHVPTFTYTKLINVTSKSRISRESITSTRSRFLAKSRMLYWSHLRDFWPAFDVVLVSDQAETAARRRSDVPGSVKRFLSSRQRLRKEWYGWILECGGSTSVTSF